MAASGVAIELFVQAVRKSRWRPWRDRVDVVRGTTEGTHATGLPLRPDCHIAWTGHQADDASGPRVALTRWFGPPLRDAREPEC
ncbi:hypothetical protein [Streptomyces sp. NPDC088746]|uniref:aromatic-ring hydroxylase C-terminal domain-containing protein n=1 Tax=Streptomyces sp. NPDC088746 TaxID=3365885 RepID=UPI00380D96C6